MEISSHSMSSSSFITCFSFDDLLLVSSLILLHLALMLSFILFIRDSTSRILPSLSWSVFAIPSFSAYFADKISFITAAWF
jgi:hypothetical protein